MNHIKEHVEGGTKIKRNFLSRHAKHLRIEEQEKISINEPIILGKNTKYPLRGILSIPVEKRGLLPAVVLVHGSGPLDMNEKMGNNYPFKDLAEGLTNEGIAVLRYDKRTFVYLQKMLEDYNITVKEETIEDAILAAHLLRQDHRIDAKRIFIIGHSLGGMLAPRIDVEGGDFAGIIILAGTPRTMSEVLRSQADDSLTSLQRSLKWNEKKQITKMIEKLDTMNTLSYEEAKSTFIVGYMTAHYLRDLEKHPVKKYLDICKKPMFILQGGNDAQVTVNNDFIRYKKILWGRKDVTFKLYANLNHLFMPSIYGTMIKLNKEYAIAQHVDKQIITDIVAWIFSINS